MKKFLASVVVILIVFVVYSQIKMKSNNPDHLLSQVDLIESYIAQRDVRNTEVSKADVAWHLDHMLKTILAIGETLSDSNPELYESSFSFIGTMSLTFNYIPRGRAQSPASVRPPDVIHTEDIEKQLALVRSRIPDLLELDKDAHFDHPVFGTINRGKSIRFLEVHTQHHLKIVKDILK